jgi:SAM-dependent methyltransferase
VERYVIEGARQGYDRLLVLAEALGPGTGQLFDRVGLGPGMHCLDLGCGSGEVSFTIAERVGPAGSVVGVDMYEVNLGLARRAAERCGLANVEFRHTNVNDWSDAGAYDLAYARMLPQTPAPAGRSAPPHVVSRPSGRRPGRRGRRLHGGVLRAPLPAHDFFLDVNREELGRRGGYPQIGRKLHRYFVAAGAGAPEVEIVQA